MSGGARAPAPDALTPADRYQELFVDVQTGGVFADSKTFVDCAPRMEPERILAAYRMHRSEPGFDLADFVGRHFTSERPHPREYVSIPGQPIGAHIDDLWHVLMRLPARHPPRGSLLPLPRPYLVPGGRFGELYYWDSYFTMIGLGPHHAALLGDMVENFAALIDAHGHVPNGTRTYYASRSQPPVFALMVELAESAGIGRAAEHLDRLRREHAWWMRGAERVPAAGAASRVVRLPDGALLNRYWDDRDTPREESWLEDSETARACSRPPAEVFRDLRAACESGWDFSTRWLHEEAPRGAPPQVHRRAATASSLTTICTTDIVPVDLNAFLWKLETTIARLARAAGDAAGARDYDAAADARRRAILAVHWNDAAGAFFDHDWRRGAQRRALTAATAVPLFVGLAEPAQANAVAATLARRLLAHGGLATTELVSDQQWDRPNGWAPLQWMAIRGLASYGEQALADAIATRWLAAVTHVYEREGKLVEKYALAEHHAERSGRGGGGEYPLQDGFGWTNGVTQALLARRATAPR